MPNKQDHLASVAPGSPHRLGAGCWLMCQNMEKDKMDMMNDSTAKTPAMPMPFCNAGLGNFPGRPDRAPWRPCFLFVGFASAFFALGCTASSGFALAGPALVCMATCCAGLPPCPGCMAGKMASTIAAARDKYKKYPPAVLASIMSAASMQYANGPAAQHQASQQHDHARHSLSSRQQNQTQSNQNNLRNEHKEPTAPEFFPCRAAIGDEKLLKPVGLRKERRRLFTFT